MDIKEKVIESQRKIIDDLAECEVHVGMLYDKYAAIFPAMKTEWSGLATAEKTHADMLKSMHRILDKKSLFFNLGKFGKEATSQLLDFINEAIKSADKPGFTMQDAVNAALKIETSIIDAHFYDIVTSDAPEFKIIADRLTADTKKHIKAINEYLSRNK